MQKFLTSLILVMLLTTPAMSETKKPAILVVSFGTSMPQARKAIDNLVDAAKKEFPDSEVRLSFTSNIIRRKIQREQGEFVPNPSQALANLNDEGFKQVTIVPTHMIPGEEYDELAYVAAAFGEIEGKYGFEEIRIARPFLDGVKDCEVMADILIERFAKQLEDKEVGIVLMGHGTPEHFANALYSQLQLALNQKAYGRFFLGTVEAAPLIDDVVADLKRHPEIKKLVLSPLMIVAGDHANNDLAGEDESDSWLNILKGKGYTEISTYLVGLGEDENIAAEFVKKIHKLDED